MSAMQFNCPQCSQLLKCDSSAAGKAIKCPKCAQVVTVPPADPSPAAPLSPVAAGPKGKTSGLAVASLVLSLGSLLLGPLGFIPGIVCGHLAKSRLRRDPAMGGRGLANAGLGIGYGFLAISIIVPLVVFTFFFTAFKEAMDRAEEQRAGKNKAVIVQNIPDSRNRTNAVRTKSKSKSRPGETSTASTAKSTPPAANDVVTAVEKVVKAFIEAENNNDLEGAKKLFTTSAQKNIKNFSLGSAAAIPVGEKQKAEITKTVIENETAKSNVKVAAKPFDLITQFRLKQEASEWRIHAVTLLMDNDEPAFTVDFEKGLTPVMEGDPQKVAAYMARLVPDLGKAMNSSKKGSSKTGKTKSGSTTQSPAPPPTTTTEPEPPKVKPAPEPVVALEFGNRRRPMTFDFVEFTGTGAQGGFKANAINHANKSIRRLDVKVFFLDAGASPLGEADLSLLESGEPLVLKNAQAQLEFNNVKISPDARKAIIELREAYFMDGTHWRLP